MRLVYPSNPGDCTIRDWVISRIPYAEQGWPVACVAVGVENEHGDPVFGIVWSDYREEVGDIVFSLAADSGRWRHGLEGNKIIRQILAYPFIQLECNRITSYIRDDNKRAIKLAKWFGAKHEGTLRKGFGPDHDMLIFGLLREEVGRWLDTH